MSTFIAPGEPTAIAGEGIHDQGGQRPENTGAQPLERQDWRFAMLALVLALLALTVLLRLVAYQVFQWGKGNDPGGAPAVVSPRGTIVDRKGVVLAADRYFYSIAVTPYHLTSDEERRLLAQELEALIGLPANRTFDLLVRWPGLNYLELAKEVPLEQGQRILDRQQELQEQREDSPINELNVTPAPKRYYPQGQLASHAVGFVNAERGGFYGVEGYYDDWLLKEGGVAFTSAPQESLSTLAPEVRRYLPSHAGKDLVLTIDATLQWIVEDELRKGLEKYKAERGTIIAVEPQTGAILAMASLPNYNPNRYGEAPFASYLDPAVSEQYEPGSVFKIITMAAGLDTGTITPTMMFNDTGVIAVGSRVIFNSQRVGYGRISAVEAFARSLNVVTAQVAVEVGAGSFYEYVRRFGFGSPTDVDLAGEVQGALKTPGLETWSLSDLGTNSFGQGLAVTPLQMVNAVASIANDGRLMRPYVVQSRVADGKASTTEPTVLQQSMTPEHAQELTDMMVQVVEQGNKAALVEGYTVAGKSGTAQIPTRGGYEEDAVIASFVGFAPAQDPAFALIIKLERPDPEITQWASNNAAPMFAQISKRFLEYLNIPPDAIRLGSVAGQ
jgi:cell division protein FtsI/penicillin-binding protein 2